MRKIFLINFKKWVKTQKWHEKFRFDTFQQELSNNFDIIAKLMKSLFQITTFWRLNLRIKKVFFIKTSFFGGHILSSVSPRDLIFAPDPDINPPLFLKVLYCPWIPGSEPSYYLRKPFICPKLVFQKSVDNHLPYCRSLKTVCAIYLYSPTISNIILSALTFIFSVAFSNRPFWGFCPPFWQTRERRKKSRLARFLIFLKVFFRNIIKTFEFFVPAGKMFNFIFWANKVFFKKEKVFSKK